MRGGSERSAREQQQPNYWSFKSRSPRHSQSTQSGLADQASKLSFASAESLETMSEADMPLGFSRMNRLRQSLPLSRSASQSKLRSPGVLFLQFGDETRRVHITHELSSLETLHALIAHMFPQKLTASMLKSPNTAILIKDEARNVFYELEDVRDIQDRSVIKIYRKEPIYGSYGTAAHLANGDLRREMVYTSRESSPTRRLNTLPSSTSSTSSGSPARSRLSYASGRPPSFSGQGHAHSQGSQHGHHGSSHGPGSALTASPSAILERRDVKPDEEVAGKGVVLLKAEGLYADPYGLVHEGRLSVASTGDPFGFPAPAGLYRRGSVRSLSTYSAAALQADLEEPLYKPGAGLYSDGYGPASTLGFRLPPSSPQKVPDVQLRDRDSYSNTPSRGSPVRQSFRKDSASSSVFIESPKSRPGSSSEPLGGDMGRGAPGFGSALVGSETDTSRDRMEAMEKQIASLTGLVQSVLTRAPDSDSTCGLLRLCMMAGCPPDQGAEFSRPFPFSSSEKTESGSDGSGTGPLTPSAPLALMPPPPAPDSSPSRLHMQIQLQELKQNATDLRKQLSQLRKIQLQNQQSVLSLMKRTETELSVRVSEALRKQEDPLQRQRLLVEEERLKYLNEEELIIQQLHDLEKSVEEIQKESSLNHRHVSLQELEEKASVLRRLGETLTELKSQFPGLQSKMRVVLRVEVEAVKFLKEEPHRLDALLKRCRTITDTLATLKRQVNEGIRKTQEDLSSPAPKHAAGEDYKKSSEMDVPTSPPLNLSESSLANWSPHSGHGHALSHSHSNPTSGQRERDLHGVGSLKGRVLEELGGRGAPDKTSSVEVRLAAERDWEEKRASLTQYSAQDINRLLEETQAELMKAIPDLDFAAKQIKPAQNQNQNATDVPPVTAATPEHKPSKAQHGTHKVSGKDGGSRRGSDELTVARYRTEKPSKSPPPPPPRRSFPSSPGLTTRSGELIIPSKGMKKSESEEVEAPKPHVKLRRSVSEAPRPASTPPTLAGGERENGEEERTAGEHELHPFSRTLPHPSGVHRFTDAGQAQRGPSSSSVPQIVLTECISVPASSGESSERASPFGMEQSPGTVQQDGNVRKGVSSPSYFRHVVKIPSQETWRQVVVTSPKRSSPQELETTNKEFQARTRTGSASLPGEKVLKRSRKVELRIQESFETEDEKETDRGGELRRPDTRLHTGDARVSPCLGQPSAPSEHTPSSSVRGQGVGEERKDIKHSTYRRLDSLEETIRELELSLLEFGPPPSSGHHFPKAEPTTLPARAALKDSADGGEVQKPPVPPKPSVSADVSKTGGGKAISRLKQLQQGGCEKSKLGKHRDDFLKSQGQQQQ
ncbi:SRC kinase signaling inhibitor 1 isoform X5 [Brachyhypopomus gauderio]|uniref:SRC kinase signaling inhibitor 1 isoform X5 n=2 Tax=Brachyhypopomus gauderio TaxID=698409 RepID=UPI0040417497